MLNTVAITLRYLLALCFVVLACGGSALTADAPQYETQIVSRLQVVIADAGTKIGGDTSAIAARLKTREGEFFSQTNFDADLKALSLTYDKVEPIVVSGPRGLEITLHIWPKPTIRSILWEGNERVSVRSLRNELGVSIYSLFDRQAFNTAFHKLERYYMTHGFFEAELSYDVRHNTATNEVDIVVKICEGRAGRIKEIRFCDFEACERAELIDMIATKRWSFFTSWLTMEGNFSVEAIERDKLVILHYLQNRGYADAKVDVEICQTGESRIVVLIKANKGERYQLGNITVSGNTLFNEAEVYDSLQLEEGCTYSPEELQGATFLLSNLYGRFGYIETYINYEAKLRSDAPIYDIHFTVEEGKQYRVGLIKIFGNCVTQNRVILHETLLQPGEVFNIEKLQKSEERLVNIGYFKSVNVYAARGDGPQLLPENYRDVYIEVEETTTGHFGLSLGYSTVESVFGEATLTERNFNIRGFGRVFKDGLCALRGGGEYAHLTFTLGNKSRRYVLSWTKPFFMDTPWSVGFEVERSSSRYISDDYDIEATGFTLHANYQMNAFMRFGWHYRLRNTYVTTEGNVPPELRHEAHIKGLISATGVAWSYDSTNHPTEPTCGLRSRAEFEVAGIWGDHYFLNFGYLNSYYVPIGEKGVLQFKADFKFIQTYGPSKPTTLPLDERFFLGGEYTVRGYRPYRLGPKFSNEEPRGGVSLQYYSMEYSRHLFDRFEGFLFADAGQLSLEQWHMGGLSVSTGFGARIKIFPSTPPLTLGMGFPLNAKTRSDVKRFFLTIGGRF